MSHAAVFELLHRYGYGLVFGLIGLEATGLPLPGETVMVAAALYAAATHRMSIGWIFAAAVAGAVGGGGVGFAIGRFAGRLLRSHGYRFGLSPDRQLLGRYLIARHGAWLVLLGRFVAVLRSTAFLLAGASGMRWPTFLLFNLLGGIAWPAVYCLGAYGLGQAALLLAGRALALVAVGAVLAILASLWTIRRHERRWIAIAQAAQASGELPLL